MSKDSSTIPMMHRDLELRARMSPSDIEFLPQGVLSQKHEKLTEMSLIFKTFFMRDMVKKTHAHIRT